MLAAAPLVVHRRLYKLPGAKQNIVCRVLNKLNTMGGSVTNEQWKLLYIPESLNYNTDPNHPCFPFLIENFVTVKENIK